MIRKVIKPSEEYLHIKVPKEYIGREVEVLIFGKNEAGHHIEQSLRERLKEFEYLSSQSVKLPEDLKYSIKMEDEINDDLF